MMTIFDLIRRQAELRPGAPAILAPDREPLGYAGLLQLVEQAAARFAALGFARGSRIALALPNGPEMAVALLSAASSATCAPLNPESNVETLRDLLGRMRIDALVVPAELESPLTEVARDLGVALVRLRIRPAAPAGTFALEATEGRRAALAGLPSGDDIAMLMHTSGTTGRPKIVPWAHHNVAGPAVDRAHLLGLTEHDRCLCLSPMFTANGIRRNLLATLAAGASIVCVRGVDSERYPQWLASFQPTFIAASPTIHKALVESIESSPTRLTGSLRLLVSTSAAMSDELAQRIERAYGIPLLQAYASTEGGAIAQSPLPPGRRKPGSVGVPAGATVAVMGQDGAILAAGELGEVVVRGPEVMAGYEADEAANGEAFRDGWFRTGDLGRFDEDGHLFIEGRLKELVNRGGMMVSPREIDEALERHPAVAEAAAFAVPHPTLGEDIAAAVVIKAGARASAQEIRDHAVASLAAFHVPSTVILVDALPRNALGKVERRVLAERHRRADAQDSRRPDGPLEEIIADAFREVLGIETVTAGDSFFALGGDSLRSATLVSRLNAAIGARLTVRDVFLRPTVEGLAERARVAAGEASEFIPPPITRARRLPPARDPGKPR